jgi:hypothetical protein
MENVKPNVNSSLNTLRGAKEVLADIRVLENVKSAYRHFLASYEAQLYCDNKIQVLHNLQITKAALSQLYSELYDVNLKDNKVHACTPIKETVYKVSPLEVKAIMLFNSDNRFTITE